MTELDLSLIRRHEHEMQSLYLCLQLMKMQEATASFKDEMIDAIGALEASRDHHISSLVKRGFEYLAVIAEMTRIRNEVMGGA